MRSRWFNVCLRVLLVFSLVAGPYSGAPAIAAIPISANVKSAPGVLLNGMSFANNGISFQWKGKDISDVDAQKLISYYYTALAIPEKDWWVNLGITFTEDDVISNGLADTELGYTLLNADLRMKTIVNEYLSPDSETGAAFWEEMSNRQIDGFSPRFWMVPGEMEINYSEKGVLIKDAKIAVRAEVEDNIPDSTKQEIEALLDKYILPNVEKEINTSSEFAPLRSAYYAMVLASWTKLHQDAAPALKDIVNSYTTPDVGVVNIDNYGFLVSFARRYMFTAQESDGFSVVGGGGKFDNTSEDVIKSEKEVSNLPETENTIDAQVPEMKISGLEDKTKELGLSHGNVAIGYGDIKFGEGVSKDDFGTNVFIYNATQKPMLITKELVDQYRLEESLGRGKVIGAHFIQFLDKDRNPKVKVISYFSDPKNPAEVMKDGDVIPWMANAYDIAKAMTDYLEKVNKEDLLKELDKAKENKLITNDLYEKIETNITKVSDGEQLEPMDVVGLMYGLRSSDRLPEYSMQLLRKVFPGLSMTDIDQYNFNSISSTLVRTYPEYGFLMPLFSYDLVHEYLHVFRWEDRGLDERAINTAEGFLSRIADEDSNLNAVLKEVESNIEDAIYKKTFPAGDFLHVLDLGVPGMNNGEIVKDENGNVIIQQEGLLGLIGYAQTDRQKAIKEFRDNLIDYMDGVYRELLTKENGFIWPYSENGEFDKDKALANLDKMVYDVKEKFVRGKNFDQILDEARESVDVALKEGNIKQHEADEIRQYINEMAKIYGSNDDLSDELKKWLDKTFPKEFLEKDGRLSSIVSLYAAIYFNFFEKNILPKLKKGIENIAKSGDSKILIIAHAPGKSDPAHFGHIQAFFEKMSEFVYVSIPTNDNGDPNRPLLTTYLDRMYFPIMMQFVFGENVVNEMKQAKDTEYYYSIGEKLFPALVDEQIENAKKSQKYLVFTNYFFGVDHLKVTKSGAKKGINEKIIHWYKQLGFSELANRNGQVVLYNPNEIYLVVDNNIGWAQVFLNKDDVCSLGYDEKELELIKSPSKEGEPEVEPITGKELLEQLENNPEEFADENNLDKGLVKAIANAMESDELSKDDVLSLPLIAAISEDEGHKEMTDNAKKFLDKINGKSVGEGQAAPKNPGGLLLSGLSIAVR